MTTLIPFCPNRRCRYHRVPEGTYTAYSSFGFYTTQRQGRLARYLCKACGSSFSSQTFSLSYYLKKEGSFAAIQSRLCNTEGIRAIGRTLGLSCASVSNRIGRMARNCTAMHEQVTSAVPAPESLAADGFESFCCSQYFPNNIHMLVGRSSQFFYRYDYALIRRKGRMSEAQKKKRAELETRVKYPVRSIEQSFRRVLDEGLEHCFEDKRDRRLELWTDEKQEYARVLRGKQGAAARAVAKGRLVHRTISSKAARTKDNPLWAVNYLDRELRKDLKEHVRETVCWGRNVNNQMERLSVYLWQHNYIKPYRIASKGKKEATSHAEHAGYETASIKQRVEHIWNTRAFFSRGSYGQLATMTWMRRRTTPLKHSPDYLPSRVAS